VAKVPIVNGDTKVVDEGKGDGLFFNTTGLGVVEDAVILRVRGEETLMKQGVFMRVVGIAMLLIVGEGLTLPCAGTGRDGAMQTGVARRYTDNGDGTITDHKTGLIWEKKDQAPGGIHNFNNTYTWGTMSSPYTMDGTMVTTFLAALNAGSGFAGHTDWRIPNRFELESIAAPMNDPAVDTAFSTNCVASCTVTTCSCTQSHVYWSSTTYLDSPLDAWFVYFGDGYVNHGIKGVDHYVRAVRDGS
jgi:hypothetical protein